MKKLSKLEERIHNINLKMKEMAKKLNASNLQYKKLKEMSIIGENPVEIVILQNYTLKLNRKVNTIRKNLLVLEQEYYNTIEQYNYEKEKHDMFSVYNLYSLHQDPKYFSNPENVEMFKKMYADIFAINKALGRNLNNMPDLEPLIQMSAERRKQLLAKDLEKAANRVGERIAFREYFDVKEKSNDGRLYKNLKAQNIAKYNDASIEK